MQIKNRFIHILKEMKAHLPFTLSGAVLGVIFMLTFKGSSGSLKETFFNIAHPGHVVLSAMVTAAMFKLHSKYKNFFILLIIGWVGSLGIATLSDIIIPHFLGTELLGVSVPVHSEMHEHKEEDHHQHEDINCPDTSEHDHSLCHEDGHKNLHLAFIEEWHIINPAAILGVLLAYFWPKTKFPHAAHILVSTWASSSYILMQNGSPIDTLTAMGLIIVLFIAVWLPCCLSDIIFPLLFVKGDASEMHCCHIGHHHHTKEKS